MLRARGIFVSRPGALLALMAVLTVSAGCREHTDTWHCDTPARAACSQWTMGSPDPELVARQKEQCRAMGGAVDDGPCSGELVIGSCIAPGGGEARIIYYPPRTREGARGACLLLGGRWH
jgi:hypothetical protein